MTSYKIEPKELFKSNSRRWFADGTDALEYIKNIYKYYPKNNTIINRLDEFSITEINIIPIDLGGMMHQNTPVIEENIDGTVFKVFVTQIEDLVQYLDQAPPHMTVNGVPLIGIGSMYWNIVITQETKKELISRFSSKAVLYAEMIEGFNRHLEETIAASNGRVIRVNSKRK